MTPLRIAALLATVLILLCFFTGAILCFRLYVIPTSSMEDTILRGDRVLVEKVSPLLGREPRVGDIVAHLYPLNSAEVYVKRIVGVPGDRLRIVNKHLYRNGAAAAEPYAKHVTNYVDAYRDNFPSTPNIRLPPVAVEMLRDNVQAGEVVIPQGKYFVLGDNRDYSSDSRYWGFISKSDIIGRPLMVYLSIGEDSKQSPPAAKGRWERLFKPL